MMAQGDLLSIECMRGPIVYHHYGIDIGDGTVVHLATEPNGKEMCVQRVSLAHFHRGAEVTVEQVETTLPADKVAQRALAAVGNRGYHLVVGNCEHFAREIKTGRGESHQVDMFVSSVVRTAFSGIASTSSKSVLAASLTAVSRSRLFLAAGAMVPTLVSETARHGAYMAARRLRMTHEEAKRTSQSIGHAASAVSGFAVGGPAGSLAALAISVASDQFVEKIKK